MDISLQPIGIIHSPFKEKFAVPRQPGLVPSVTAKLELFSFCNQQEILRGLEDFSHIWLIFIFHQNLDRPWRPTVRPPRLGGNQRVGVFASRSPFRPNPLGLSAVELLKTEWNSSGSVLHLRGADLVDGTPVLDIKPYLPYSDALPQAKGAFAPQRPTTIEVAFSPQAEQQLVELRDCYPHLRQTICELLGQDPRPAYRGKKVDDRLYGVSLYDLNLKWKMEADTALVLSVSAE